MMSNHICNKQVIAKCSSKDRYGRDNCKIWYHDKDINRQMVERGGAWVYRRYYNGGHYYQAESATKSQHIGLWPRSEAQAIAPWQWLNRRH